MRFLARCALLVLLCGCGGDDPVAPAPRPEPPSLAGQWTYDAQLTSQTLGPDVTCFVRMRGVSLRHSDAFHFTGTTGDGSITCRAVGIPSESETLPAGSPIINGMVDEQNNVSFDIETPQWSHGGTVEGESMRGLVALTAQISAGKIPLSGSFTMNRTTTSQ